MKLELSQIIEDLAPFSDLGTEPPVGTTNGRTEIVRLIRSGAKVTITFDDSGLTQKLDDSESRFLTFKSLLASPSFANLGQWADSQKLLLRDRVEGETLPLNGSSPGGFGGLDTADQILINGTTSNRRNTILLIDGPAGIGKTSFIRRLSYHRAKNYRSHQRPLILHVESRGRVLQNITDLMAFSLQTLRLSTTYDQVPVLVRNGLITLAIDGFDELGDPHGYDLAWAQLNDLIMSGRGSGSFLLSGRETFISSSRVEGALHSIDLKLDTLDSYTILPVSPTDARSWLQNKGWSSETLSSETAQPLFEEGSYALRPFFLNQLASIDPSDILKDGNLSNILSFLMNAMIEREATKFGKDVDAITTETARKDFIALLMEEIARDMADNQTDSVAGETLVWLSDMVSGQIPQEVQGILRNRVQVLAFLTTDLRRGHRRFIHEQVQNYFLSQVTIRTISSDELPKYVRRNIIGLDFLENFADVVRGLSQQEVEVFVRSSLKLLNSVPDQDRARRNLASLIVVCCSVFSITPVVEINDVSIDEALVLETVTNLVLRRSTIAQLDARGADISAVEFSDCHLVTLLADEGTIPSQSIPSPQILELPNKTLIGEDAVEPWLGHQYITAQGTPHRFPLRAALERFPLIKLLARYARYKPYWLKDTEERSARRILDDPNWPELKDILTRHGVLVERMDVPSAGRRSPFFHLRNREALRDLDDPQEWMFPMLGELMRAGPPDAES